MQRADPAPARFECRLPQLETGVPLADALKSPTLPIYVVHGGDHFTVLWHPTASVQSRLQARVRALFTSFAQAGTPPNDAAAKALQQASSEAQVDGSYQPTSGEGFFDVCHWNGLPPSRGLGWLRLRSCGEALAPAPAAPPVHVPTAWRLTVGEVESVVQAAPAE